MSLAVSLVVCWQVARRALIVASELVYVRRLVRRFPAERSIWKSGTSKVLLKLELTRS